MAASEELSRLLAKQKAINRTRSTDSWQGICDKLERECHPKQAGFVVDPGRRVACLVPRGGGKTTAGRARLVRRMLKTPRARCLFIATTRVQAEELMWGALKDLLHKLGIDARFNETKLKCTLVKNGSTLRLVGADDKKEIDKLRGQPFHEVGIDEAASHPVHILEALIHRIIGPRLGDYGGCLWIIGTPGHDLSGLFYETTMPGATRSRRWEDRDLPEFANWRGWSAHHWQREDALMIPEIKANYEEGLLEKEQNGWSDDNPIWLREHCGQWAADNAENIYKYRAMMDGKPWNQWDPKRVGPMQVAELPLDADGKKITDWIFGYGMDLGHADPFALSVFAMSPSDQKKRIFHVYEYGRKEMYAREIAGLLVGAELEVEKPAGIIKETGWPAIMVADLAGLGDALILELQNVYGIGVAKADKKSKFDSIELFNGDLIDGRIRVLKGSILEEQLKTLQWKRDEYGKLSENKAQRNDQADASLYCRRHLALYFEKELPAPPPRPRRPDPGLPTEEVSPMEDYEGLLGGYSLS